MKSPDAHRDRYLELVKDSLLNALYPELEAQLLHVAMHLSYRQPLTFESIWNAREDDALLSAIRSARDAGDTLVLRGLDAQGMEAVRPELRNYIEFAHTLVGRRRLDHLQGCVETVLREQVPGDLVEAGVWRGGASILMKAVLTSHGDDQRRLWLADSFRGLPPPSHAEDAGFDMSASVLPFLAVSAEAVSDLFRRYGLLDERVKFVEGWFHQSLVKVDSARLALLRIDADLYSSTFEVLTALYPVVSPGGFVIVDDYRILPPCRKAVDAFRDGAGSTEPLEIIDGHAVAWRKSIF